MRAKNKVLVCGSIALDLLGRYAGSFADYQQKYPIDALNFSLQLSYLRTSYGGCGMNIIYGLNRLGVDGVPLTAAGANFEDHYRDHLDALGIRTDYIVVDTEYPQCATAIVFSDELGNQITGFYPGASPSPLRPLPRDMDCIDEIAIAVLAPEDAPIMLRQARDLADLGIPVVFDPGQGISEFSADDVRELVDLCDYVITNAHEWEILQLNGRISAGEIIDQTRQVIVTRSAGGVDVYRPGEDRVHVPALRPERIVEVTGSGDAFRAGYVLGLLEGRSPRDSARMGTLAATYNLEAAETQRYDVDRPRFDQRYAAVWGEALAS